MYYNSFPERLKEAMNDKGMKQSDLCKKTKIDKSLISHYLSGNFKPKEGNVKLIAKVLDVNPAWLMGYNVSKSNDGILKTIDNSSVLCDCIIDLSESKLEEELLIKATMLDDDNKEKILDIVNMYLYKQGDYYENNKKE